MAETMEQKGMELMQRRDVPEHIREAAYIMLGVFSRLAESEKEKQNAGPSAIAVKTSDADSDFPRRKIHDLELEVLEVA